MPEKLYKAWLCMLLVKLIIHQQTNDHIAEPLFTGSLAWPGLLLCLRNQWVSAYTVTQQSLPYLLAVFCLAALELEAYLCDKALKSQSRCQTLSKDTFEKQHGMISEHVEESKSPVAWFRVMERIRLCVTREVCNTDDS